MPSPIVHHRDMAKVKKPKKPKKKIAREDANQIAFRVLAEATKDR
jgi:hypothetical protein